MQKETVAAYFKSLFQHLPRNKNNNKMKVRITGLWDEIRSRDYSNTRRAELTIQPRKSVEMEFVAHDINLVLSGLNRRIPWIQNTY
jgi:hypothetical protein